MRRLIPLLLLAGCAAPVRPVPERPPLALGADLHCHVTMARAARPVFWGEGGRGPTAGAGWQVLLDQVEPSGLREAGVRLLLASVWPPFDLRPGRSAADEALGQLAGLRRFADEQRLGYALAGSASQARALLSAGKTVLVPAVEGGEGLTRPEEADLYLAAGARVLTLVHFVGNDLGGAANGQLGVGGGLDEQGLTPLGKAVVERLIRLGVLLDVAHASDRTIEDVLALTEAAGVPVIHSHTGARALSPVERNVSDALAVRIARGGGLLGVTPFVGYLETPDSHRHEGEVAGSCDDLVAHWRHLARVAGPGALVLGSDFNGFIPRPGPGGGCPQGLRTSGDLKALFAALEQGGVPRPALDRMGERLLEVLERVEQKADPRLRQEALRLPLPRPGLDSPL